MLIKKERLKENNEEYEILYFGKDEDNISATVKRPVQNDIDTELPEQEDVVETDEVLAEILLNQTNIKAKQEEQDEVLAMLLLNSKQKGE